VVVGVMRMPMEVNCLVIGCVMVTLSLSVDELMRVIDVGALGRTVVFMVVLWCCSLIKCSGRKACRPATR
jgi:hypothetical protein